jgi:hypothetical protein
MKYNSSKGTCELIQVSHQDNQRTGARLNQDSALQGHPAADEDQVHIFYGAMAQCNPCREWDLGHVFPI